MQKKKVVLVMKNSFWVTAAWSLLLLISLLSGVVLRFTLMSFHPIVAAKTACLLALLVLLIQLPHLLMRLFDRSGGKSE